MGVGGLWQVLKENKLAPRHKQPTIASKRKVSGRFGVDGNIALYSQGRKVVNAYGNSDEALGRVVRVLEENARRLIIAGATSVHYVFDGLTPDAKEATTQKRKAKAAAARAANPATGLRFEHRDAWSVYDALMNRPEPHPKITASIGFFEAESELAVMSAKGVIDVIITEDSDQVVCCAVRGGNAKNAVIWAKFNWKTLAYDEVHVRKVIAFFGGEESLLNFALATGNDYWKEGMARVGRVTALDWLRKPRDNETLAKKLERYIKKSEDDEREGKSNSSESEEEEESDLSDDGGSEGEGEAQGEKGEGESQGEKKGAKRTGMLRRMFAIARSEYESQPTFAEGKPIDPALKAKHDKLLQDARARSYPPFPPFHPPVDEIYDVGPPTHNVQGHVKKQVRRKAQVAAEDPVSACDAASAGIKATVSAMKAMMGEEGSDAEEEDEEEEDEEEQEEEDEEL